MNRVATLTYLHFNLKISLTCFANIAACAIKLFTAVIDLISSAEWSPLLSFTLGVDS